MDGTAFRPPRRDRLGDVPRAIVVWAVCCVVSGACSPIGESADTRLPQPQHHGWTCADLNLNSSYFPVGTFHRLSSVRAVGLDQRQATKHSALLVAMREPPLACGASPFDEFRIVRVIHADAPVSIRASLSEAGAKLRVVTLEAPGWMVPPGELVIERRQAMAQAQWLDLQRAFESSGFWSMDPTPKGDEVDDLWIVEAVRGGTYRVVVTGSRSLGALQAVGTRMLALGGLAERDLAYDAPGVVRRVRRPLHSDPTSAPIEVPESFPK